MAIDASIYNNLQTPQIKLPDPLDIATKGMQLSTLGMQQAQMVRQLQTQQAVKQAYANNTDPQTGQLNRQGYLSDLAQVNPQMASDQITSFANQDKAKAEAQAAQLENAAKVNSIVGPAMEVINKAPTDQQPQVFQSVMKQIAPQIGPDAMKQVPQASDGTPLWDPDWFKTALAKTQQSTEYFNNQKTIAETNKANNENAAVAQKRQQDYQMKMEDDDQYKAATKTLTQGNGVLNQINDATGPNGNPQSKAALGLALARLTPDGTRLPADEIQKQALAGNFGDKIKQMVSDVSVGTLNPQEADYARQFVTNQMQSSAQAKADRVSEYSRMYSADTGIDKNTAFQQLSGTPAGTVTKTPAGPAQFNGGQQAGTAAPTLPNGSMPAAQPVPPHQDFQGALNWLKTADPTSPKAFQVRAKLKAAGYMQ